MYEALIEQLEAFVKMAGESEDIPMFRGAIFGAVSLYIKCAPTDEIKGFDCNALYDLYFSKLNDKFVENK